MTRADTSVSVGVATLEDGTPGLCVKIQTASSELNVWMRRDEMGLLERVKRAKWEDRGSLQIGRSATSAVFWSVDGQSLSIMVGADDEAWDFAVTVPASVLDDIMSEVEAEQTGGG